VCVQTFFSARSALQFRKIINNTPLHDIYQVCGVLYLKPASLFFISLKAEKDPNLCIEKIHTTFIIIKKLVTNTQKYTRITYHGFLEVDIYISTI
jgi:hypothetical protein